MSALVLTLLLCLLLPSGARGQDRPTVEEGSYVRLTAPDFVDGRTRGNIFAFRDTTFVLQVDDRRRVEISYVAVQAMQVAVSGSGRRGALVGALVGGAVSVPLVRGLGSLGEAPGRGPEAGDYILGGLIAGGVGALLGAGINSMRIAGWEAAGFPVP